jgi:predicted AAA+ superfamily ATPase
MVMQLKCIREAKLPLADYASDSVYEVFMLDHGLLHAIAQLPDLQDSEDEAAVEDLFGALNGGYGEQFVMSELLGNPNVGELYYWVSGATARVPLVFEGDEDIIPVDIRFSANSKAQNLRVFNQKYKTMMSMRLSMEDMYFDTKILNIPVYGLWNF